MRKIVEINKPGRKKIIETFDKKEEEREVLVIVKAEIKGRYEIEVLAEHSVGDNRGNLIVRGIAKNGADVSVRGIIKIDRDAQKVEDFLDMRFIIMDDKSKADVRPVLEIEANDVKASHAASVGKIDQEQINYLMSRGIGRKKASEMIVEGFLEI